MSAKNTLGGVAIINAILVCEQKNRGNLFYLSRGDAYMLRSVCCSIYPTQAQMNYQPRIEWVHIHLRNENILTNQLQHPRNTHFASETIICNNNNLTCGIYCAWHTSRDLPTIHIYSVYIQLLLNSCVKDLLRYWTLLVFHYSNWISWKRCGTGQASRFIVTALVETESL